MTHMSTNGTNGPVLFGSFDPKRTGPNGAKLKGDNFNYE